MDSTDLKHRPTQQNLSDQQQQKTTPPSSPSHDDTMNRRKPKNSSAAARRGLRSLSVALALPLSLTLLDIFLFGSSSRKPFSFPPPWALHLAFVSAAFLSGLSAWLVWAEGGFHRHPTALGLYLGQLGLSLVWYPAVFGAGAIRVGLVVCGLLFGALLGCARAFASLNPIAGDLVKPCLAWALLLAVANVKLL